MHVRNAFIYIWLTRIVFMNSDLLLVFFYYFNLICIFKKDTEIDTIKKQTPTYFYWLAIIFQDQSVTSVCLFFYCR